MAEIVLKHVQKVYPNNESKKKGFFGKKKKTEEKKHNLKVTEDGVLAVEDFNLTVHDQEFVVLVGPSGCGKSTTMRMVAGLEDITSGDVLIDGKRVNDVAPKDRDIAMVFQSYALYPNMTVYENMAFTLELKKVPKDEIDRKVRSAAEILGITEYLDRKPKALSGGQRQRVAIGRAIVRDPKVFLMDEPLSNLDAKLRNQMRAELIKLRHEIKGTFIYVTHDQTEAMTLGDRIVVMKDGVVQQVDTPQNLYDFPANEFVAGFIGSPQMNFFDVRLKRENNEVVAYFGDNKIVVPQGKVSKFVDESYVGREVVMGIRPENIHDDEMFLANAADAAIDVKVEVTEKMGSETYLYLTTTGKEGNIIARVNPRTTSVAGAEIKVAFDVNHLHFFDKETARTILVSDAVPAPTKTNLTK